MLSVISIVSLLRYALPRTPTLASIVIAVPEYQSIDIAANPFAVADAQSVEHALDRKASLLIPKDLRDLERFLSFEPNDQSNPLVVYIDMASISDGEQGYLLTTEAESLQVNNAYSIRNLLEQIWRIPASRKLLILNTNHTCRDLRVGTLENEFSHFLKTEFSELTKRSRVTHGSSQVNKSNEDNSNLGSDSTDSFIVLCSSADGQPTWGSPSLGHTPFAELVSYCLGGGPKADQPSKKGGRSDGFISTAELSKFVIEQTYSWSNMNRESPQTPIVLRYGDDFTIATVNRWQKSKIESSRKEVDTDATASSSGVEKQKKGSASAQKEGSAKKEQAGGDKETATAEVKNGPQDGKEDVTGKKSSSSVVSPTSAEEIAGLLNHLMLLWETQQDLESNSSIRWQPNNWSAVQQLLIHAEASLIAGELSVCQQRLVQAEAIFKQLKEWQPTNPPWDWSIVFADRKGASAGLIAEKTLVEGFLKKPAPESFVKLIQPQSVEGQLLVSLARQHSIEWVVEEASVVRLAVEIESLAARVASHRHPLVNQVILPFVAEADRVSRRGQVHLFAARSLEAAVAFRKARVEYRRVVQLSNLVAKQLAIVESTLATLPFYIDWIGNLPPSSAKHDGCVRSLQLLMENFNAFQNSPQVNQLDLLASLCNDFVQLLADHAAYDLSSGDYCTIRTTLRLPTISVGERRDALELLLSRRDELVPIDDAVMPIDRNSTNSTGRAFPLNEFFAFVNQLHPRVTVPIEFLKTLNENSARNLPLAKTNVPLLSQLSQVFREFLRETRNAESNRITKAAPWQQHWQTLALAYWLNQPNLNPRVADAESVQIYQEALASSLQQAYERIAEDSRFLPAGTYDNSLNSLARSLERDSHGFRRDSIGIPVQLVSSADIRLSASGQNSFPIQVLLPDRIPDGVVAKLRLNWDDEKLVLAWPDALIVPGQMTVDLGPVVPGQLLSIQPKIAEKSLLDSFSVHELIGRLQFMKTEGDSSISEISQIKWLPTVTITTEGIPQNRADLLVSWSDQGATPNRVDLLPNQKIALNLSVKRNVADPLVLVLKARGHTGILGTVEIKDDKPSPIKPLPGPGFVINEGVVTFELYEDETLVDEESVAVGILDLNDCLQRQVTFNPRQRTVTAVLQQTQFSDSPAPVDFQLATNEDQTIPGRLSLSLERDHNTGSMEAQFASYTIFPTDVSISASGVPRLFRYSVYPELVNCPPQSRLALYWDAPIPKTAFKFKTGQQMMLPIAAQIDGPRDLDFQVGFDYNNNSILEPNEVQFDEELWFGRRVKPQLVPTKDGFSVVSTVSDVARSLDVSGFAGRQTLIARAESDDDQCQEMVRLYFIDSAPQVDIVQPAQGAAIAPGNEIQVVLQGQKNSAGAIDHVDFGFDINKNDVLDKNEMVKPVGASEGPMSFGEFSHLSVRLPTKGLKPGENSLLVQTQTMVHNLAEPDKSPELLAGNVLQRAIEISDTGSLVGRVSTADGLPTENAMVTVVGYPSQLTGKDGAFEFLQLPPGNHVITAETRIRSAATVAEVKAGETSRLGLQLRLK